MALHDISKLAGAPPLLWSNVKNAFEKINQNFVELAASSGNGELVDFNNLDTSISPAGNDRYNIGEPAKPWGSIYASEWNPAPGGIANGVWIGNSQIKGISGTIDLPANSTIDGNLIIDPARTGFKTISISGTTNVVADEFTDTLTLYTTAGINITADPITDYITFENTGVTSISGTPGEIGVDRSAGAVTLTNLGVKSLSAGSAISGRTPGLGISVSGSTGNISITNTGVISIQAGVGITVSTDSVTGVVTVSNSAPASATSNFGTISISGMSESQASIISDIVSDTVTFEAGYGILLTTDPLSDTLTFAVDPNSISGGGSTDRLTNGSYDVALDVDGNTIFPYQGYIKQNNSWTKVSTPLVNIGAGTVVWTSEVNYISSAKLIIQVECSETGDSTGWHSQACEAIIASRGFAGSGPTGDPQMTVYGVIHTSTVPLVTFTVRRNPTTLMVEVVGTLTAAAGGSADLRIHSVEMSTRD